MRQRYLSCWGPQCLHSRIPDSIHDSYPILPLCHPNKYRRCKVQYSPKSRKQSIVRTQQLMYMQYVQPHQVTYRYTICSTLECSIAAQLIFSAIEKMNQKCYPNQFRHRFQNSRGWDLKRRFGNVVTYMVYIKQLRCDAQIDEHCMKKMQCIVVCFRGKAWIL